MLRGYQPEVFEAAPALPNNHGALLRFRSSAVADSVSIPFRRVTVRKAFSLGGDVYAGTDVTLADANRYSLKVSGRVTERSILSLDTVDRFISPTDLVARLAVGVTLRCGSYVDRSMLARLRERGPVISTVPMPALMGLLGWPYEPHTFRWRPIWSLRARIASPSVDVYQTIYYPGPEPYYRASITGDLLIVEFAEKVALEMSGRYVGAVLNDFGIGDYILENPAEIVRQEYGKLLPMSEEGERERRAFILGATDQYGIYSLGRFATWRQILLDDLVNDISVIRRLMENRSRYQWTLGKTGE